MPLYDCVCENGHNDEQFLWHATDDPRNCACGAPCVKVPSASVHVVDDSIPGGMTVSNMGPRPETFYSKTEWRRAMKAKGLRNDVDHVGVPGTDKSPHTQRWT